MVVDRGGVRYPIEVRDRFSDPLINLRSQLRLTRQEFRRVREEAARARRAARGIDGPGTGTGSGRATTQEDRNRIARRIRDVRRTSQALREQAAAARQAGEAAERGARRGERAQQRFRRSIRASTRDSNLLVLSLRRLLGVVLILGAARGIGDLFAGLVKAGFQFNQTVEQSRLGIAGILVSVARLRDEQGRVLQGAEAFTAAQRISSQVQQDLLADAQLTTATYEELLLVFQRALGPGIAAGLNVDQIRELSVLISQAASAIGLAQNQLDEEIRALFTGNIRTNTTRLAQIVGLTNADIRGAADLFVLLRDRLIGFRLAADETSNTVAGLGRRIQGALLIVAGTAASRGFERLRTTLQGIFAALVNVRRNAEGVITAVTPNPRAQAAFDAIFDSIDRLLQVVVLLGSRVGFAGLQEGADTLAATFDAIGRAAVFLFDSVVQAIGFVRPVVAFIIGAFREVARTINDLFGEGAARAFAQAVASAAISLGSISALIRTLQVGFAFIAAQTFGTAINLARMLKTTVQLGVAATTTGAALQRNLASLGIIGAALAALTLGFKVLTEQILGVSLTWDEFLEVVDAVFEQASIKVLGFARSIGVAISEGLKSGARRILFELENLAAEVALFLKEKFGDLDPRAANIARGALRGAAEARRAELDILDAQSKALIAQTQKDLDRAAEEADKRAGEAIERIRAAARRRADGPDAPRPVTNRNTAPSVDIGPNLPSNFVPVITTGDPALASVEPARPRVQAVDESERTRENLRLKQAQLRAEAEIARIKAEQLPGDREAIALADVAVSRAQDELALLQRRGSLTAIEQQLVELKRAGNGESEQAVRLEDRILRIKRAQAQLEQAEAARRRLDQGAFDGAAEGFRNAGTQFGTAFQAGFDIVQQSLQAFSQTVSGIISDALNPEKEVDVEAAFGSLLTRITDLIISKLTDQAVVAAVNFILSLFNQGGNGGNELITAFNANRGAGQATGGPVPSGANASPAHFRGARGYATGGLIRHHAIRSKFRPRNLDRRDTVPIWAQPGEHMMQLSAVQKYGRQFMADLNAGAIDPAVTQGMATTTSASTSVASTTGGQGFASGGVIPRAPGTDSAMTTVTVPGPPQEVFLASTARNVELFLGGDGEEAFRRQLRKHKDVSQS